ncbi:hypothetical protein K7432_014932 [Basidiobolus ranarum]|uniref:LysM domain-containing protein n=1 Tax=Basidiobolus ranarum TaxID=34480 RepID=A0ABR2WGT1_9FUNG
MMCAAVTLPASYFSHDLVNDSEFQGFMEPGVLEHQPFQPNTFQPSYFAPAKTEHRPLRRQNTIEALTDPLLNSSFPFVPIRREKTQDDIASEIEDALSSHFSSSSSLPLDILEKRVIVHRIKNTDTLAGIALLYGVTTDGLKRINKLWSDNLHLRRSLYIPLEIVNYQEVYLRLKSLEATESNYKTKDPDWDNATFTTSSKLPVVEIVSVPEAELKFFSVSQNDPQEINSPPSTEFIQEDIPSLKEIFGVSKLIKFAQKIKHRKRSHASQSKTKTNLELRENLKP